MKLKQIQKMTAWLTDHGCEILKTTNPYELVRWKGAAHTGVIYKSKKKGLAFNDNYAEAAHFCFVNNRPWLDGEQSVTARPHKKDALIQRDGNECFYCGDTFTYEQLTHEHLLSRAHGGNNHMSNLVLACSGCNNKADHLPVIRKIEMRDEFRGYVP